KKSNDSPIKKVSDAVKDMGRNENSNDKGKSQMGVDKVKSDISSRKDKNNVRMDMDINGGNTVNTKKNWSLNNLFATLSNEREIKECLELESLRSRIDEACDKGCISVWRRKVLRVRIYGATLNKDARGLRIKGDGMQDFRDYVSSLELEDIHIKLRDKIRGSVNVMISNGKNYSVWFYKWDHNDWMDRFNEVINVRVPSIIDNLEDRAAWIDKKGREKEFKVRLDG
nr:hypothetical protein [Tanacetum cinerariifolium]